MGAYNEVVRTDAETCPRCNSKIHRVVQFKYGDTWQHRYAVGDRLKWGGNDIGERGHKAVVVIGDPVECPVCGYVPDSVYDVMLRDDVIDGVRPSDGTYAYIGGQTYFVVEP
jgi:DNA-directed RNA polymerase subunit RPC12/RpoP